MRPRKAGPDLNHVMVVSANPETLDGLQTYLRSAGVSAAGSRDLHDCVRRAPASSFAFVFFPDDFRWEQVVATLADLASQRPQAVPVLVTAHPQRYARLTEAEEVLIVPRPAWGWTILDLIRAHLHPP